MNARIRRRVKSLFRERAGAPGLPAFCAHDSGGQYSGSLRYPFGHGDLLGI